MIYSPPSLVYYAATRWLYATNSSNLTCDPPKISSALWNEEQKQQSEKGSDEHQDCPVKISEW